MSDHLKGLDTFAVGYAAAKAELTARITALETENAKMQRRVAMLVDAANDIGISMQLYPDLRGKVVNALNSTSAQSAAWLEQSHREWMKGLPIVGYWFPCKNANGSVLRAAYLVHEGYEPLYALPVKE